MKDAISSLVIKKATRKNVYDLSNQTLYNLCKKHFAHLRDDAIIAKTLLIGRSYAAAIDRRKNKNEINDHFYLKKVVPVFKKSQLDSHLADLSKFRSISSESILPALRLHGYLTARIRTITKDDKESFASKYLHFHLPNLFFLYDTRVLSVFRNVIKRMPTEYSWILKEKGINKNYAILYCKCLCLQKLIHLEHKTKLSPRQLDNVLINLGNKKLIKLIKTKNLKTTNLK